MEARTLPMRTGSPIISDAIFSISGAYADKGATWEKITDNLKGGVMHMCPDPDGNGMVAGTSDGSLLLIDDRGVREVVSGLPFVTSVELAA